MRDLIYCAKNEKREDLVIGRGVGKVNWASQSGQVPMLSMRVAFWEAQTGQRILVLSCDEKASEVWREPSSLN